MLSRKFGVLLVLTSLAAVPALAAAPPAAPAPATTAKPAAAPIKLTANTKTYKLELQVVPTVKISTPADVKAGTAKDGEVLVRGIAASPKDAASTRHLELRVYSLDKNALVTDATVSISMIDTGRKLVVVPIAVMNGIAPGAADTHYGNNVSMAAGTYTVDVTVNGEKSTFSVAVPAS